MRGALGASIQEKEHCEFEVVMAESQTVLWASRKRSVAHSKRSVSRRGIEICFQCLNVLRNVFVWYFCFAGLFKCIF